MDYIEGISRINDQVIILLNTNNFFTDEELGYIKYED
jgi:hypothetical protein